MQQKTLLQGGIGPFTSVMIVMGSLIGSGVFKKIAPMSAALENPSLVLAAWFAAGLITMLGALTNAEIASLFPESGGQYIYFKKMYGNLFAYLYGWACFTIIQTGSIASIAYVFGESFQSIFHISIFNETLSTKFITIFAIALLSLANYLSVRYGGAISNFLTVLKILGILLIVILGLGFGEISSNTFLSNENHSNLSKFFAAMMGAFWAYDGWNNLGYLGSEIKDPQKNIPKALILGIGSVIALYLIINFSFFKILSPSEIIAFHKEGGHVIGIEAIKKLFGTVGALLMACLVMISTLGTTNNSILSSARIYYAMAKDKLFFPRVAQVHPRYLTPSTAIIAQCLWAIVLVMSGTFDQLTDLLIFATFMFYGAGAIGIFIFRKSHQGPRSFQTWGYPFVPAIFILFCISLTIYNVIDNPKGSLIGIGLILLGLPFYFFFQRKSTI